ncbi:methionyl-tRNA formyltransferase [Micrococcoides hystricis]|uniref:Methionyl-tRNA formyltransferase n=1 Tax=Micrococcoides hystricis TaxID=1572761 RepID=A0ABV6P7U9_9MICC
MTAKDPIIFAGTPPLAADALNTLLEAGINVAAVLTRTDAPVGRKRVLTPSPVAQVAEEHGLPVIKADRIDEQAHNAIKDSGAKLGVVVAYGALLKQHTLDALPHGWVNLHYSLLPAYRGAAPVQRAMIAGEQTTGISVFKLTTGLDTGPLVYQQEVAIPAGINAGDFLNELTATGAAALTELVPQLLAGTVTYTEQSGDVSHAPKLSKEDGLIDFDETTVLVAGRINGTSPTPGAWAYFADKPIKFFSALPVPAEAGLSAGDFDATKDGIVVGTADGALFLSTVQPAGKRAMSASDWVRGVTTDKHFHTRLKES